MRVVRHLLLDNLKRRWLMEATNTSSCWSIFNFEYLLPNHTQYIPKVTAIAWYISPHNFTTLSKYMLDWFATKFSNVLAV
jgi:hypothetical protein